MRRAIAKRIAVSLLALWVTGSAMLQAEPALRSMRGEHFEVIGFDLRSVSYVNELSIFTLQIAERYLAREGMAYPTPILISLRPGKHADFEGDYRIRLAQRGAVQLDLRWEDSLTLERTCRAISEALIVQYAVYNHGIEAPQHLRAWPVTALGIEVYFGLRPAKFIQLLNRTRENEVPLLPIVVEALQSDAEDAPTSGYWLLQAMKSGSMERPVLRSLFQQAIAGIDIEEALTAAVQPNAPTAEPLPGQAWWAGQLDSLLSREYDVIEPMDVSRGWLAALARFNGPLTLESGEVELNLRSLWTHRAEPEVQQLVQARYDLLRLRMARINFAYFNPARSLGVLFEVILSDAPSHKYLHALVIYLSDWEDAKEMQQAIETIFD